MSTVDNQQIKSSHMSSLWVTTTHIKNDTCPSHVRASNEESQHGNVKRKDSHGIFLLNARPKLKSKLNLNSKFAINSQQMLWEKFQIKDHWVSYK